MVNEIKKLEGNISDDNLKRLDLFFSNCNLDEKQRQQLVEIIYDISDASIKNHLDLIKDMADENKLNQITQSILKNT